MAAARLPREMVWALLAAPILVQPVVNAEFFTDPIAQTASEAAGNFVPALAIVLVLLGLYRWVVPSPSPLAVHVAFCAAGAAFASAVVHSLHAADTPLVVYLQRNVGLTCLVVVPALALQDRRARAHAAERRALEEQQSALRVQLASRTQPHFLFNVLNTIASFVRDDPGLAERTIQRLSDVLRHALDSSRRETVPLARELEVVEDYLEIQKARFGPRLRFELTAGSGVGVLPIPPFLVQPLVENAVLHGVASRTEGGTLRVSAFRHHDVLEVRVDDDGPGPGRSTHRGSGTSLEDLARRVALVYGPAGSFETSANDDGGFCARLRLPIAAAAA